MSDVYGITRGEGGPMRIGTTVRDWPVHGAYVYRADTRQWYLWDAVHEFWRIVDAPHEVHGNCSRTRDVFAALALVALLVAWLVTQLMRCQALTARVG